MMTRSASRLSLSRRRRAGTSSAAGMAESAPELPRHLEAVVADVRGDDPSCAEGAGQQQVEHPGDTAAEDQHSLSGLQAGATCCPQDDTGQRFDKGALIEGHLIRQEERHHDRH